MSSAEPVSQTTTSSTRSGHGLQAATEAGHLVLDDQRCGETPGSRRSASPPCRARSSAVPVPAELPATGLPGGVPTRAVDEHLFGDAERAAVRGQPQLQVEHGQFGWSQRLASRPPAARTASLRSSDAQAGECGRRTDWPRYVRRRRSASAWKPGSDVYLDLVGALAASVEVGPAGRPRRPCSDSAAVKPVQESASRRWPARPAGRPCARARAGCRRSRGARHCRRRRECRAAVAARCCGRRHRADPRPRRRVPGAALRTAAMAASTVAVGASATSTTEAGALAGACGDQRIRDECPTAPMRALPGDGGEPAGEFDGQCLAARVLVGQRSALDQVGGSGEQRGGPVGERQRCRVQRREPRHPVGQVGQVGPCERVEHDTDRGRVPCPLLQSDGHRVRRSACILDRTGSRHLAQIPAELLEQVAYRVCPRRGTARPALPRRRSWEWCGPARRSWPADLGRWR